MDQLIPIAFLIVAAALGMVIAVFRLFYRVNLLQRDLESLTREVRQMNQRWEEGRNIVQPSAPEPQTGAAEPKIGILRTPVGVLLKRLATAEPPHPLEIKPDELSGQAIPPPIATSDAIPPSAQARIKETVVLHSPAAACATEPAVSISAASPPTTDQPSAVGPSKQEPSPLNWERFMGTKLLAWIGGFVLFLAVAFFVKLSFERNLIPPELRVALGYLTGIGLLISGTLLKRQEYRVTAHTFCATGVVILYAAAFGGHAFYHLTGPTVTFLLMVLVTVTAFLLSVRLDARVVAVLGLAGGFLTPPLLSTGQDRPLGLFGYIAILVLGLMAVAFKRQWHFLIGIGAVGTVLMQWGWVMKFFMVEKVFIGLAVFLSFNVLFLLAFLTGEKLRQTNHWLSISAGGLPFGSLAFAFYLLTFASLGERPEVIFALVLGADLCLLILAWLRDELHPVHVIAGSAAFLLLTTWIARYLTTPLLNWALGLCLLFAILHTVYPVVLKRLRPGMRSVAWSHLFPLVALILVTVPLVKDLEVSWLIWPCLLVLDCLALCLAILTATLLTIAGACLLTVVAAAVWIQKMPVESVPILGLLVVVGGFGLFFFLGSLFAGNQVLSASEESTGQEEPSSAPVAWGFLSGLTPRSGAAEISALSAIMPFLLLILASARLSLDDPSPLFALALLLVVLLLGLSTFSGLPALVPIALGATLALEYAWQGRHFSRTASFIPLIWYLVFYTCFLLYPFLSRRKRLKGALPWVASALSGPLHFALVYRAVSSSYPNEYMGLLPAAFAVPALLALQKLARQSSAEGGPSLSLLAWFGASALFFITLIFPIQFERQWITIGWALEGVALLALFRRLPHPGLRLAGVVLLGAAFVRLALNPAVLSYHPRGTIAIWNWYLYSYGIVTACLMVGGKLLAPPRNRVLEYNAPPLLFALGTILAFLLLNIEIADYFSTGATLTFQFSGDFARDMTYSIGWGVFALVLLMAGIANRARAARYASLALLSVTLVKLFFHDLSQLDQLYRIGAFIGVALVLILASVLYQRFLAAPANSK
jgi:uncharacterized membrane protein